MSPLLKRNIPLVSLFRWFACWNGNKQIFKFGNFGKYLALLFWIQLSFAVAMYLFSRGLLLRRDVLPHRSKCVDDLFSECNNDFKDEYKILKCMHLYNTSYVEEQHCLNSNFKVVLLIIDALRFDFMQYDHTIDKSETMFFQNKMPVVRDILATSPNNSRLYKFIADPPTTTSQRINGLTTGSLPTFIDVGSNFGSSAIDEDNIVDALIGRRKNVTFLGDDTWMSMYPNQFFRSTPFDSFNVWDLDTVDNGIKEHLFDELKKNDWSLLIAHFLGVDHCGHRYGMNHPEMERKLTEMNEVLRNVVKELQGRPDVLLFVIGDHGMTFNGDHGGDTASETTSALFAYSPVHPLFGGPRVNGTVNQVDLVPTLSSILSVPIPFSNTGSVVLECMPTYLLQTVSNVVLVLWRSVEQITNYVRTYSAQTNQFGAGRVDLLLFYYASLKKYLATIDKESLPTFVDEYRQFMDKMSDMCREAWIQFGHWSIAAGIVYMMVMAACCMVVVTHLTPGNMGHVVTDSFLVCCYSSMMVCVVMAGALKLARLVSDFDLTAYMLILVSSVTRILTLCWKLWPSVSWPEMPRTRNMIVYAMFTMSLLSLFANSFIYEESSGTLYLFVVVVWTTAMSSHRHYSQRAKLKCTKLNGKGKEEDSWLSFFTNQLMMNAFMLCLAYRLLATFAKCREEQVWCRRELLVEKADARWSLVSVFIISLFVGFMQSLLDECASYMANWASILVGSVAPKISAFALCLFWLSEAFPSESYSLNDYMTKVMGVVMVMWLLIILYMLYDPLYMCSTMKDHPPVDQMSLMPKVNTLFACYSTTFANIGIFLSMACSALMNHTYVLPTVSMFGCLWYLAFYSSMLRRQPTLTSREMYNTPWSFVIMWALSASYFFYVTGHNSSFSGIQWNAAFLIQREINDNFVIPGILVLLNTFVSYIVHGIMLPLLVIAPFTLNKLRLSFMTLQNEDVICSRNETTLVKESETLNFSIFILVLKYNLLFVFKVLATMLAATLHCRHLMMWNVFAPKFVFESLAFITVTIPSCLIGYFVVARVTHHAQKFFSSLTEESV